MSNYPYYEGNILVEEQSPTRERRTLTIDGVAYKIRRVDTGAEYDAAVDPKGSGRVYEETDTLVGVEEVIEEVEQL